MPFVRLTLASNTILNEKKQQLVNGLVDLLARDLNKKPEVIVTQVNTVSNDQWYVNTKHYPDATGVHVEVTITKGSNTQQQKEQFLGHTYAFLNQELGVLPPVAYIVLYELDATTFGYNGLSQAARRKTST